MNLVVSSLFSSTLKPYEKLDYPSKNFYMADDASYDLVEKYLPVLEQKLKDKGYQCTITMTKEEKKVSFGDDFLRKDMPQTGTLHRYSFDVRA